MITSGVDNAILRTGKGFALGLLDWFTGRRKKTRASKREPARRKEPSVKDEENKLEGLLDQLETERNRNRLQEIKLREMEDKFQEIRSRFIEDQIKKETVAKTAKKSQSSKKTKRPQKSSDRIEPTDEQVKPMKDIKGSRKLSSPIMENKKFTNFVVDDSNRFPYLASEAVATGEGRKYNPLFIFGPVGVGKTHLLHAIANRMKQDDDGLKILYSSTERFTEELIKALEREDIAGFRNLYREVDVLLVDDIQMLSGREATQKEFFHMFNHLYNSGRQIVLCSDRPPSDIKELETRLRSRFEGGLIIDIQVPTFEGRRQILVNKAQREGFSISTEVLDYLSFYLDSSVRELEGGFNRVTAYASLMKEPITVNLVRKVLSGTLQKRESRSRQDISIKQEDNNIMDEDGPSHMEKGPMEDLDLEEETEMIEKELLYELHKESKEKER
jgi:chromosomal replication initiator protein DnaA